MRAGPSRLEEIVRQRIRELRHARGLTQEELCERAEISIDAISRIEGGSRVPTLGTLERIASALGVSPVAFLEGVEPPPKSVQPAPLRRVVSLLERHPEPVLTLAEDVVTALVHAYRDGAKTRTVRRRKKTTAK